MAQKSIVLMKNENNVLPLNKNIKKIAVVGPNADDGLMQLGNYNGTPSVLKTVLQGIKEKLIIHIDRLLTYQISLISDIAQVEQIIWLM